MTVRRNTRRNQAFSDSERYIPAKRCAEEHGHTQEDAKPVIDEVKQGKDDGGDQ